MAMLWDGCEIPFFSLKTKEVTTMGMKKFSMKQMLWDKMVVKTIRGILKLLGLKK